MIKKRAFVIILLVMCKTVTTFTQIHDNIVRQAEALAITVPDFGAEPPCPWQSVRLQPYAHIQVDIRGTQQEINALDLMVISRDLWRFWMNYQRSAMELVDRRYNVRYHTSYPYRPMQEWTEWVGPDRAFFNSCNNCNGWEFHKLPGNLVYAKKQLGPDDYMVSFVQFMKSK